MIKLMNNISLALITAMHLSIFCCQNDNSSAEPITPPAWIAKVAEIVSLEQLQTAFGPLKELNEEQARNQYQANKTIGALLKKKYKLKDTTFAKKMSLELNCLMHITPALKTESLERINTFKNIAAPYGLSNQSMLTENGKQIVEEHWQSTIANLRSAREKTLQSFENSEKTSEQFIALLLEEPLLQEEKLNISLLKGNGITKESKEQFQQTLMYEKIQDLLKKLKD